MATGEASILEAQGSWSGSISVTEASDLISRARIGDKDAFAALYREYVQTVHRFVAARVKNPQKAEDIVAETFVKALRNINRFEFRGIEFSAWLVRIARNLIMDNARSATSNLEVLQDETPEGAPEADTGDLAMAAIEAERLRGALDQMIPDHRTVLELRFVKGYPVTEVSQLMAKSEGAVRVLQYRALRAMKRYLEKNAPDLAPAS
ncbi:MAG TPA: sigma-70 family RNA polymerase sigma factor [Actinomycetota bacterium]|nr:sigma-70 family RNA polymerase sigma factor [Actinomycetota bacterium]